MTVEQISLELIHDNPYQARLTYHKKDIDELAHSIKTHGLLQVPPGRRKDGDIELGFGHLRKRAFAKLAKKEPEKWGKMPIDIRDLSDEQMAMFALEENLKRRDISPLETARAVEKYLVSFPGKTEVEVAEYLNMTKGNVSNMRRVLRLPEKVLEKIDEGRINFHQGRELIILEKLENSEELMRTAIRGIKSEASPYGHPNTVEGMQQSIHDVAGNHCRPLDKQWEGYRWDILFDTRAAGCLECDKMVKTHPTKSATAHWCLDETCWEQHQEEHREKAAAEAKAKMEAEVINQAAQMIAQEEKAPPAPELAAVAYKIEKRGTSWIAIDDQGIIIAIDKDKQGADAKARASFEPVVTKLNPSSDEYLLNHTYRIIHKNHLENVPDVTAQDLATAIKAVGVRPENVESAKVHKSSGKLGTGGWVSAGWSKCTETLDDFSQEKSAQWRCGQCNVYFEFSPPGDNSKALVECPSCHYEYVTYRRADGVFFCLPKHNYAELPKVKIPSTLLSAADEEQLEARADERDRQMEEIRERANLERPIGELPCETCLKGETCDRSFFHVDTDGSGRLVCDQWEWDLLPWALAQEPAQAGPEDLLEQEISRRIAEAPAPQEIPEDILAMAREKAGTRAEVLDLNDICAGERYWRQVKQGYAILDDELRFVDDPAECLESCTHGFHYAFDSKASDQKVIQVCSDTKCLAKKKAALTRKNNAAGQALKKAETKAVKQAIDLVGQVIRDGKQLLDEEGKFTNTLVVPRATLKLILLAQIKGKHLTGYYYGDKIKQPEKWLWDRISAGTPENDRTQEKLFKAIDKRSDEELARIVVEFMFYFLMDHGDIGTYELQVEEPLEWMGVTIERGSN